MRRLALESPLLLVLDDAQFADDATLDAIEYATLSEAGSPIWAGEGRASLEVCACAVTASRMHPAAMMAKLGCMTTTLQSGGSAVPQ